MLAEHLGDLARREAEGPSVLLAQTDLWLEQMAEHFPGTEPASYVSQARRVMRAVFNTTDSASGTRHLIEEICAAYGLYYEDSSEPYAVAQYALDANQPPLDTALLVRKWPTHSKANSIAPLADGARRVVVAVINQVKGLTFEATWLCALQPGTFPFRGIDESSERCKFWVACTRATDLLVIHLPERDKRYLELAGEVETVGSAPSLVGGLVRFSRRSA